MKYLISVVYEDDVVTYHADDFERQEGVFLIYNEYVHAVYTDKVISIIVEDVPDDKA